MIGLPKRALSPVPIEHRSQQRFNISLNSSNKLPNTKNRNTHRRRRRKDQSSSVKRSYSVGKLKLDNKPVHGIPNLQQYVAPSMRTTLNQVPNHYVQQIPDSILGRRAKARTETLKREKIALRALSKHAGLGLTKIRFRSDRVSGEIALTQIATKWQDTSSNSNTLRRSTTNNYNETSASNNPETTRSLQPVSSSTASIIGMEIPATSSLLPTPKEIEKCLQALEMLPSHLAVVVPTLRLALYSNNYAGIAAADENETDNRNNTNINMNMNSTNETITLDTLPYYAVSAGLETTNRYLLDDIELIKQELNNVKIDRNDQRKLLQKSNFKNNELREKINNREADNDKLKKMLVNMREIASDHLEDNNNTTKRYVELDIQHSALRTKHKSSSEQLFDLREVYSSVSNELSHALRTCGQNNVAIKSMTKKIDETNKTLAEHANLKAQYEQMALEFENVKEELEMAKDDLKRYTNKKAKKALQQMGLIKGVPVDV